ncbi:hypothetical protein HpDR95_01710 [Helicobacter pylori]
MLTHTITINDTHNMILLLILKPLDKHNLTMMNFLPICGKILNRIIVL